MENMAQQYGAIDILSPIFALQFSRIFDAPIT
ncbi:MAG: hypothetical protein ACI8XB_002862 [Patiriisocius sp.]|jgi:hypothetical protein